MLHPIRLPDSHIALTRTVELQSRLMAWLCDPATSPASVTAQAAAQREPDVAGWLTWFLGQKGVLQSMKDLAGLPHKATVHARFAETLRFGEHFDANIAAVAIWPPALPRKDGASAHLKTFLQGFYSIAFKDARGLPYDAAGKPARPGLIRSQYVRDFRLANFDRVCCGCDGDLDAGDEFDHWVGKAGHPCLAIHPENLVLLCHKCNYRGTKGEKPTYSVGATPFADWFHPWLRQAVGKFDVSIQANQAIPIALDAQDAQRIDNLDKLLRLTERWSIELDSQIKACLAVLEVLIDGDQHADEADASSRLAQEKSRVHKQLRGKPHTLVTEALLDVALKSPSTIRGWLDEARVNSNRTRTNLRK